MNIPVIDIFGSNLHIALRQVFGTLSTEDNIWGMCHFLGTTMLIFTKFIKIATSFLYESSSYDAQIKSYRTLKSHQKSKKMHVFWLCYSQILTGPLFGSDCNYLTQKIHLVIFVFTPTQKWTFLKIGPLTFFMVMISFSKVNNTIPDRFPMFLSC